MRTSAERLALTPLPALALMRPEGGGHGESEGDGEPLRLVILAQSDGKRVLFQEAGAGRPTIEPVEVFASQWSGRLILISSRASLVSSHEEVVG